MAILFVNDAFNVSTSSNNQFTLNKPSGVQDGDLLIALVAVYAGFNGASVSGTAPTGWTRVVEQYNTVRPSFPGYIGIFSRVATAADGATWTGTYNRTLGEAEVTIVACYRGAQGVLASGISQSGSASSLNAPSLNNTQANSWRLTLGAYTGLDLSSNIASTETTLRERQGTVDSTPDAVQAGFWDSGGPIATGSSNKAISRSIGWDSALAATVILREANTNPASGDLYTGLPSVSTVSAGNVHDDGVISTSLPKVSADLDGEGVPQPSSGGFTGALPKLSSTAAGYTDVRGGFSATLPMASSLVGETRIFGIRVIPVPSRGVEG
jgi:hypothetical protein